MQILWQGDRTATGINDSAQVVGYETDYNLPFLYSGGVLQSLPGQWQPQAINNVGQILNSNGSIYSGGVFQSTGLTQGYAINNSGQVAGVLSNGDAGLYRGGTVQDLGNLPGASGQPSWAYGINNSGRADWRGQCAR